MERTAILLDYCDQLEHIREKRRARRKDLELLVDMCLLDLSKVASIPTNNDIMKEKIKL